MLGAHREEAHWYNRHLFMHGTQRNISSSPPHPSHVWLQERRHRLPDQQRFQRRHLLRAPPGYFHLRHVVVVRTLDGGWPASPSHGCDIAYIEHYFVLSTDQE